MLALSGLAYAALSSAVIPALPTIQHDLHTTETGVAWLLTGFLLSASVGTAIIGRLGDMYGKERLLLGTLVVLAAGTALAAVSNSLGVLIVARVIQGTGGGIFPLAFSIIRDEFPADRVPGSIGLVSAILGVGGGAGLVLGGLIVEHLSWHWLFWLPLIVMLPAACVHLALHPRVSDPVAGPRELGRGGADERRHLAGADRDRADHGVGLGRPAHARAARGRAACVCASWVAVEVRSREPLVDMAMMRIRGRVDDQPGRVPARRRHVRVVHRLPGVRPAPQEHRVRLRGVGRRLEPVPAARRRWG